MAGAESLAFSYDAANRITQITNGMNASVSQTLSYDALSRLTAETASAENESYQYDADGDRTYQVVNGAATGFAYPAGSNRLSSTSGGMNATYGYDADGDTTSINGHTVYQYGPFDRLANADGYAYENSAGGQRISKSGGGNVTYFALDAGSTLLAEDDNNNWMDYVWLNGRLVTVIVNGGVFPIHGDQTGRPLYVTHPNTHAVLWQSENLPFYPQLTYNAFWTFNVGFPGQYYDSESGLWHNGNRDYNPLTGRYIESDPIGLAGGINTYAYVGNNPITGIDPTGLIGYVCQKGNNVGINIPIDFKGATPAEISAMTQAIASAWSGQFGQYNVVTTAPSVSSFNSAVNVAYVVQGRVDAADGKISRTFGGQAGMWMSIPSYLYGIDYAHEAGHMLGLSHAPGTGSVMNPYSPGRSPTANDISNVLANPSNPKGCGCGG